MPLDVIVYVLTALAAVVVVLTRVRLRRGGRMAGRIDVPAGLVTAHFVLGVLALLVWVAFLVADEGTPVGSPAVGIVALALWWLVAGTGLLILVRWLPSQGRHAARQVTDSWSGGPGLSVLAHVGMVVGVVVFTYAYLTAAV